MKSNSDELLICSSFKELNEARVASGGKNSFSTSKYKRVTGEFEIQAAWLSIDGIGIVDRYRN